jgi:hypothetical protein
MRRDYAQKTADSQMALQWGGTSLVLIGALARRSMIYCGTETV